MYATTPAAMTIRTGSLHLNLCPSWWILYPAVNWPDTYQDVRYAKRQHMSLQCTVRAWTFHTALKTGRSSGLATASWCIPILALREADSRWCRPAPAWKISDRRRSSNARATVVVTITQLLHLIGYRLLMKTSSSLNHVQRRWRLVIWPLAFLAAPFAGGSTKQQALQQAEAISKLNLDSQEMLPDLNDYFLSINEKWINFLLTKTILSLLPKSAFSVLKFCAFFSFFNIFFLFFWRYKSHDRYICSRVC